MYSSSHHGTFNPAVITNKEDLQISEGVIRLKPSALADKTLLDLHSCSYHTQPRSIISPLHEPVTWYKITHAGEQVAQWDFHTKPGLCGLLRTALFWKSHCAKTCSPALIIERLVLKQTRWIAGLFIVIKG